MSRLNNDARLPAGDDMRGLKLRLYDLVRDIVNQLNFVTEGSIRGCTNAATAAPTTGSYTPGDFVRNSAPVELGTAGAKYVVTGFICIAAGPPAVFKECRVLTGG